MQLEHACPTGPVLSPHEHLGNTVIGPLPPEGTEAQVQTPATHVTSLGEQGPPPMWGRGCPGCNLPQEGQAPSPS